jgi:CubicO group peptidase (beta-lactamase class C family)
MTFNRLLLTLCAVAALPLGAQQREPFAGYDAYVNQALAAWKVPGVGIAIVRNDSVIYAKGYGLREIGKPDRVDERTFFAIGSSSKAFTAAAVAMLVDERKVRWDDAAAKFLPALQLYDPYATRELTIRDLLSHRSGLARGDLLWYGTDFDRAEILRRVRFLEPSWSFRSQFGYQNLMYLAAGELTARVVGGGKSWDDVIDERIFAPLGMTTSNTSVRRLAGMPNVATPHSEIDDTVRVVPWRNIDNIAPAGSINSNVVEMANWVRLQLNKGKFGGRQVISSAQIEEMHKPHTIVPLEGAWKLLSPASHFLSYGLGWFLQDYRGEKVVQHGGNIDGMSALVGMIPEKNFGVVILTNMNQSGLPYVLMNRTFDAHLKAPARDWSAEMRKSFDALVAAGRDAQKRMEAQRVAGTRPSLPLAQYAGTYVDSMYGEAVVTDRNGTLYLSRGPAAEGSLEHWHFDTFRATWRDRGMGKTLVAFQLGTSGKVDELQINLGGAPVTYRRRPAMADTTPGVRIAASEVATYVGRFESKAPPIVVSVERMGDALHLNVPGQPMYTLVPVTRTRFKLTGPSVPAGFYLDYAMDGRTIRSVTLEQPAPRPPLTLTPIR